MSDAPLAARIRRLCAAALELRQETDLPDVVRHLIAAAESLSYAALCVDTAQKGGHDAHAD